jgi:uroporphyrinogen decarboxylase
MNPRERVLKALAHEEADIVPYVIPMEGPVDQALTEHYGGPEYRQRIIHHYVGAGPSFIGLVDTPEPDGTIRDVFGGRWQFGAIFHMIEPALKEPSLKNLKWPDVSKSEYYTGLYDLSKNCPNQFTIASFPMGLFERSWGLRGMDNILMDMALEPAFCEEFYDQIVEWDLTMLEKMCDSPVDAVGFTDDLAWQHGLIMGPPFWKKYLKPRMAKLIGYIKSRGKYAYLHSCGDNTAIMEDLIDMGLDIFNPLQPEPWDIFEIKRKYGRHITFDGGISSQSTLTFGTPEQVRLETEKCLRELGQGGGYIAGPNKPILPGTPLGNAVALIETLVSQS